MVMRGILEGVISSISYKRDFDQYIYIHLGQLHMGLHWIKH